METAKIFVRPDINRTYWDESDLRHHRHTMPERFVDESGCIDGLQPGAQVIVHDADKRESHKGVVENIFEEVRCGSDMFYETIEVRLAQTNKLAFICYKRSGEVVYPTHNWAVEINRAEFPVKTTPYRDARGRFIRKQVPVEV